jgi:hypothetical protein
MKHLRMHLIALSIAALLGGMGTAGLADCPEFLSGRQTGTIESNQLSEISGIVARHRWAGGLWVPNDAGHPG